MNKNILVILGIGAIALAAVLFLLTSQKTETNPEDISAGINGSVLQDSTNPNIPADNANPESRSRYVGYTSEEFAKAADKKRVYFFHASWCPTCKAANIEFSNALSRIPEDVVLFKTDYDTERELKKKYNVTYQHTFVQVDSEGNEVSKWNGGGVLELLANVR